MSARKPLPENCNGSIDCPIDEHLTVTRFANGTTRFGHIKLTTGQRRTLYERIRWDRDQRRASAS